MDYNSVAVGVSIIAFIIWAIALAAGIVALVAAIKVYRKIGFAGWEVIIPFYNYVCLFQAIGKPGWWVVLLFVPFVNIAVSIYLHYRLPLCFGKDKVWGILSVFFFGVIIIILAFDKSEYIGVPD